MSNALDFYGTRAHTKYIHMGIIFNEKGERRLQRSLLSFSHKLTSYTKNDKLPLSRFVSDYILLRMYIRIYQILVRMCAASDVL